LFPMFVISTTIPYNNHYTNLYKKDRKICLRRYATLLTVENGYQKTNLNIVLPNVSVDSI